MCAVLVVVRALAQGIKPAEHNEWDSMKFDPSDWLVTAHACNNESGHSDIRARAHDTLARFEQSESNKIDASALIGVASLQSLSQDLAWSRRERDQPTKES